MEQKGSFFRNKSVLVTGGAGLLGSAFVNQLLEMGARVRSVKHRRPLPFGEHMEIVDGDLRDPQTCLRACRGVDGVIHAAAVSGGSKNVIMQAIPMFDDNLLMNTLMLQAARLTQVEHYLFVSNSSVYSPSNNPLREEDAWGESYKGVPENETGVVKRVGETQCLLYSKFTEMCIAIVRGGNAYGPGDNFDLESSHVIPALIRKAVEKQDPYLVWGTGDAARDFVHSHDLARGGLFFLERALSHQCSPVNVATGTTVTIRTTAALILRIAGHTPTQIRFDSNAPPASPVKRLDVTRMKTLGFRPGITLEEGLHDTVAWYRSRCRE